MRRGGYSQLRADCVVGARRGDRQQRQPRNGTREPELLHQRVTPDGNASLDNPLSFDVCAFPESFLSEISLSVVELNAILNPTYFYFR